MKKTVLIIDDDDILRNALARGLRNADFNVISATSAENAADIMTRISVDGIVLDRMMTGMDGLSFLKQLRASGNNTPVIMLTAMTGPENTIDGLANGANDYLAKPFQIRELILRLNNMIKSSAFHPQKLPAGLTIVDDEFFINGTTPTVLALSGEEKKLLHNLISPIGNVVPASPMVAKRLRNKINIVLSNLDIMTIRGQGYKLVDKSNTLRYNNGDTE